MKILIALLVTLLPNAVEPYAPQLDLEPMLHDDNALEKLVIMYDSPAGHGFRLFFVRGDGSLVLQTYPGRPMAKTDMPTCRGKVAQDEIRELIKTMTERHFWALPEKHYIFVNGERRDEGLAVHGIFVDNGSEKAARTFGAGAYAGKQESIPEDFSAIEQRLKKLADLTELRPCHFAPPLQF